MCLRRRRVQYEGRRLKYAQIAARLGASSILRHIYSPALKASDGIKPTGLLSACAELACGDLACEIAREALDSGVGNLNTELRSLVVSADHNAPSFMRLLRLMRELGANFRTNTNKGTLLMEAAYKGNVEVARMLIYEAFVPVTGTGWLHPEDNPFQGAGWSLVNPQPDRPASETYMAVTPLGMAAAMKHWPMVEFLLEEPGTPDYRRLAESRIPGALSFAFVHRSYDEARKLLSRGVYLLPHERGMSHNTGLGTCLSCRVPHSSVVDVCVTRCVCRPAPPYLYRRIPH